MNARAPLTIPLATLAAITSLGLAAAGCGTHAHVGNVLLTATVDPQAPLQYVAYQITGVGLAEVTGGIGTPEPAPAFTRLVSHVPAGLDYAVHVNATSVDGQSSCEGSATFDVKANQTTLVGVHLSCMHIGDGQVSITIGLVCPGYTVSSWTISPLTASVGGTINVAAGTTNTDPHGPPSAFSWNASAGSFADPKAAQTTYTCTKPGAATIAVTATSGPCVDTQMATVTCVSDGGVPDGAAAD
ncbi:MAG TPA: hypothetical protein VHJ20_03155 [Polyangia bacterium]|nr:hypothetical protein [Polyangia bacterium]